MTAPIHRRGVIVCAALALCLAPSAWAQPDDQAPPPPPPRDQAGADGRPERPRAERAQPDGQRGDRSRTGMRGEGVRRWGEGNQPLTPEQLKQTGAVLEDLGGVNPELAKRLEKLIEDNPNRYEEIVRQHPIVLRLAYLRQNDAKMYELMVKDMRLERQTREMVGKLRKAKADNNQEQADKSRRELKDLVAQHFDVRQQKRAHEIERMQTRVEEFRTQLKSRQDTKDKLIDERLQELTGETKQAPW